MARSLKTVIALDEQVDPHAVTHVLQRENGFDVIRVGSGQGERSTALAAAADVAVVGCDVDPDRAAAIVEEAVRHDPDRPVVVVVVSERPLNGLVERVFAAGADDIVVLPEDPQRVAFAIEKAVARRLGLGAARSGRLVTVLGPKGGTGKTFVSSNLGVALARASQRTTLVDLDLQFGDLALALGLEPARTLYDLARSGGSLDADKLDGFALPHPSGARVLLAPLRPDEAAAIDVDLLAEVWKHLRAARDYVVVDTAAGFQPELISAVDAADDLVLVGTLDAGSLKDTKLGLETVELMGRDPSDVLVVLNRADSNVGIQVRDAEEILGRAPDVLLPSDRAVPRSLNEGHPIVLSSPRSRAARAITELAQALLRRQPEHRAAGLRGSGRGDG